MAARLGIGWAGGAGAGTAGPLNGAVHAPGGPGFAHAPGPGSPLPPCAGGAGLPRLPRHRPLPAAAETGPSALPAPGAERSAGGSAGGCPRGAAPRRQRPSGGSGPAEGRGALLPSRGVALAPRWDRLSLEIGPAGLGRRRAPEEAPGACAQAPRGCRARVTPFRGRTLGHTAPSVLSHGR